MIIRFGKTTKKLNSTAQPNITYTELNCILKSPCAVESPVITVTTYNVEWNYAYIPSFGRYYWISGIRSLTNDIWEYSLTVDVLASYKSQIIGTTALVKRSASNYNGDLYDSKITHRTSDIDVQYIEYTIAGYNASGCFIIGVVGTNGNSYSGGVSLYAISNSDLINLISALFNSSIYATGTITEAVKTYFNPFQYITSCRWVPMAYASTGGTPTNINFGWYDSGVQGKPLIAQSYSFNCTFTLPASSNPSWINHSSDWTRYNVYVPGFGVYPIDPMYSGLSMTATITLDPATGNSTLVIRENSGGTEIISGNGQWGIDVPLTQLTTDITSPGTTLFSTLNMVTDGGLAEDVASSGPISGFMAGVGLGKTLKSAMSPQLAMAGASGDRSQMITRPKLEIHRTQYMPYNMASTITKFGGPCHANLALSGLSGYTELFDGNIETSGTEAEKSKIKSYLEGGFYIE